MELYLMQHGQAVLETENPEQPLSREGVAQIQASAAAMKRLGIVLDLIVCSPKKRSRQSAALVAEGVNYPYSDIVETAAVKPTASADDTISFLRQHPACSSVLIVGHLPSLVRIAALLLGGDAPVRLRFENGGLCRLDTADLAPGTGELVFHLAAAQMRQLANP
jgi:phosphohistidine phosphatase